MHYLWTALIGLVVGALAKLIMPGNDPGGFIVTMLIGIAAIIPRYLARSARGLVPGRSVRRLHHVASRRVDPAGNLPPH